MSLFDDLSSDATGTVIGESTPEQRRAGALNCCDRVTREHPGVASDYPEEAKTEAAWLMDMLVGLTPDLRKRYRLDGAKDQEEA